MKLNYLLFIVITILISASFVDGQRKRPTPKPKVFTAREIAERVMPSVVLIITQDENGNPLSQGSGFVFEPDLVVTNLHVFERATSAFVKNVKTGEIAKAIAVIAMHAKDDICVIRIAKNNFPAMKLGNSDLLRPGDDIYVASNPKGLEGTFTKGIVSRLREDTLFEEGEAFYDLAKKYGVTESKLIQLDAAISPGSSGGALIDANGRVAGIIRSTVVGGQNLNFAIPVNRLKVLERKFNHPVLLAGASAYNDRLKAKLSGHVKTVKVVLIDHATGTERIDAYDEFDYLGNNIRSVIYGSEKNYEILRAFDENGLLTHITYIRPGKKDESFDTKKEDSIKEKIDSRKYSGTFEEVDESARFDHLGNKLRSILVTDKQSVVTEYKYDDNGRVIFMKELIGDKIWSTRYKYRFDRVGNWIRQDREVLMRSDSSWFDPEIFVIREITYHS